MKGDTWMTGPKNFWRFSYDSEDALKTMLSGGTLHAPRLLAGGKYDPNNFIETRIKSGDGIVLARFDIDNAVGEAVAIGIVQNQKPCHSCDLEAGHFPTTSKSSGWSCHVEERGLLQV